MNDARRWQLLAAVVVLGLLVYLLSAVLTPFAVAAILAYMGDPFVDWLERRRVPRAAAVTVAFAGIFGGGTVVILVLVPALENQIRSLLADIPRLIDWLNAVALPWLSGRFDIDPERLRIDELKGVFREHWQSAGGIVMRIVTDVSRSGLALVGWVANLVLIPVVTFYLLRDWDILVARVHELLPRAIEPTVAKLTRDSDLVLAEFFRGQLLVMAGLGLTYSLGLWLVGLNLAILIGLVAGLVSFVPYLGVVLGLVLAMAAALIQFGDLWHFVLVAIVFGFGQLLESFVLTPLLVGDKIGLHPVAVIFAVLAGGELFGFFGVLLALPVAAVVVVILRHARHRYLDSELYNTE